MRALVRVFEMQFTGAVGAKVLIPAIPIARNPCIDCPRKKMNTRNQKQPSYGFPGGQRKSDARPSIHAAIDLACRIHRLHQPHGLIAINLRKQHLRLWVV